MFIEKQEPQIYEQKISPTTPTFIIITGKHFVFFLQKWNFIAYNKIFKVLNPYYVQSYDYISREYTRKQ